MTASAYITDNRLQRSRQGCPALFPEVPALELASYPTLPAFIAGHLAQARPVALAERRRGGDERRLSTTDVHRTAAAVAYALRARGVQTGDRVAIAGENSVDWLLADYGILYAGAVVVPVFATIAADQLRFICDDAELKLIFVDDAAAAARVRSALPSAPPIVELHGDGPDSFAALVAEGERLFDADPARLHEWTADLDPGSLAVLIYTSGTTGMPKGVMLSHRNLTSNAMNAYDPTLSGVQTSEAVLSVLPFAHIFEHLGALGYLYVGVPHWVTVPERFLDDLRAIRPTHCAVVPRILERILAAVVGSARAAGGMKAKLVPWALATGARYECTRRTGGRPSPVLTLEFAIAKALVLKKLRAGLGLDRCEYLVSGSAPLHADTAYTFAGAGIDICEGYGLTETSPVITVNRFSANRLGTVGRPIRDVEIRIAADGEIETRGPNVMMGYYHTPADQQPFTADGWFSTGDIGELRDGYLAITDRKKELFKTSGGKWIAPSRIESAIKRSVYVGQVLCVGYERPHPAVLVAPNWDLVRKEIGADPGTTTEALAERDDVRALIVREVAANTADLASFERVQRVAILPRDLTIEDGELSPTLKVKRRVVEQRFANLIEAAYAEDLRARAGTAAV